ncbi:MAG: hypothetical protein KDA87_14350 [Planctomycetales bacterium]|nr:hypothetical protein [Planctomycetales bacterium]
MEGIHFEISPQPDDETCGPTCLHAVYRHFEGETLSLEQVIHECDSLQEGGTLASLLGAHALRRGYDATIYSFNLNVFDPSWFRNESISLVDKLYAQIDAKPGDKLRIASEAYIEFLKLGGRIRMEDLTRRLIRSYLARSLPILVGLSATYLYQAPREVAPKWDPDDVCGLPAGHFVVLCGYDQLNKEVRIADPYLPNPFAPRENYYSIDVDRVVCAILLGIVTYDANLLILRPSKSRRNED